MSIKIIEEIVEKFDRKLTDEDAFYLWDRWRRFIRYRACKEWEESVWPFLEHAVESGFQLGESVLRHDSEAPFSPANCYFGTGRPDNKARSTEAKEIRAEHQRMAEWWDKLVYEPNREIVKNYKRRHNIQDTGPNCESQAAGTVSCKWCCEEVCTNPTCPIRADFCPVADYPGVCRFEELEAAQKP